jgi:hypothetical protein
MTLSIFTNTVSGLLFVPHGPVDHHPRGPSHIGHAGYQTVDTRTPNDSVVVVRLECDPIQINNLRR